MVNLSFDTFVSSHKELVETELEARVENLACPDILREAMVYSLKAGGKRIRPLLVFAVLDAFGKETKIGLEAACAIEMVHTYSLIHDDLPSMDDDDLRRGKPTNHIVFGEANAILAGDALLTLSFDILAGMNHPGVSPGQQLELIRKISTSAGPEGMVGGQVADMEAEGTEITIDGLEYIHVHKTGKLLAASVLAGAILANATEEQKQLLEMFSRHLGLAFQIRDDILDIEGDQETIGKPVGSDEGNDKNTYPALLTLQGAKQKLEQEITDAETILEKLGWKGSFLSEITQMIAKRIN